MRTLEYDIDFFYSKPRLELLVFVQLNENFDTIRNIILNFSKKNKQFYIFTPHEKIFANELLFQILELLDELNKSNFEIYLCMTTTTEHKYFLNPLCSILHYTGKYSSDKNQVGKLNTNEKIKILDLNYYSKIEKEKKGILSIRKPDLYRDLFYKTFKSKFDGIFRYSRMDRGNVTGDYNPISFNTLISEYNKSYVSFLFETETNQTVNSFTEKSMIALLSKTLPVLFLTKENQIEELNNMGFYFFNEWFGYTTVDSSLSNLEKVNLFIECIEKYNIMSISDIQDIYNSNIDRINKNHNLIKNILLQEKNYTNSSLIVSKPLL